MRIAGIALLLLVAQLAAAQKAAVPKTGETTPGDYRQPANWVCRPGSGTDVCSRDLDAVAIDAKGARTPAPYRPAVSPLIDCFYVYPTTSDEPTFYSGLDAEEWVKKEVHEQAARIGSVCRVYAPLYHQVTIAGLKSQIAQGAESTPAGRNTTVALMQGIPYRDIRAAWRDYLAHDNNGRGVVLIGHSQGAIILKKLLAEEIDGKPVQSRLVAAYLAGNPDLGTGDFRTIQPCRSRRQTGCLVAWSSYPMNYGGSRFFGNASKGNAICINPASPGGGRASLDVFLPRRVDPAAGDLPFVERTGQMQGECVTDANGAVLRVTRGPGRHAIDGYADLLKGASGGPPSYGFHFFDLALTGGNVIDLIRSQSSAYLRAHSSAAAADLGRWNGTWTVNQAKSRLKPTPLVLQKSGQRYVLHYDSLYTFACDGRAYPTEVAMSLRCRESGGAMTLDLTIPGHRIWRWSFRVGPGGQTMTATLLHMRVGKKPSVEKDRYLRSSGPGTGLLGSWTGIRKVLMNPDRAVLRVHDGYLYYLDTWDGNISDARLDGTPAPWLDPHQKNDAWMNQRVSSERIVGHELVDGKVVNTETLQLSPDGKFIKLWLGDDENGYQILDKE